MRFEQELLRQKEEMMRMQAKEMEEQKANEKPIVEETKIDKSSSEEIKSSPPIEK